MYEFVFLSGQKRREKVRSNVYATTLERTFYLS